MTDSQTLYRSKKVRRDLELTPADKLLNRNSLPLTLRLTDSLSAFRRSLKTYLYITAFTETKPKM